MMMDIKHARAALGLSQEELAERLGLHQTTVSLWESGERTPKRPVVFFIETLLREAGLDPVQFHRPDTTVAAE